MPSSVLVIGATGTVGSHVARRLHERSVEVRIASRNPETARERFGDDIEYTEFDLGHPETWGQTLDGIDRMFLMFPPAVGVTPVQEFVDAAGRVGIDHIVYLSIIGAEKVPVLPHRRIERHLANADPVYTFLRGAYFMQNLSGIHRPEIVERDEIVIPAGDGKLGLVDARDIGAVAATALTEDGHENRAYDLTGPTALDFYDVAAAFSDVLDREITYANPPLLAFARRMYERGISPRLIAFMSVEYSIARLGFASRTTDDVERVLGRSPTPIQQFIEDHRATFEQG